VDGVEARLTQNAPGKRPLAKDDAWISHSDCAVYREPNTSTCANQGENPVASHVLAKKKTCVGMFHLADQEGIVNLISTGTDSRDFIALPGPSTPLSDAINTVQWAGIDVAAVAAG
jgi:hypothetical protein